LDTGKGKNTYTSGFEGSWTTTPTKWGNAYFNNLFKHDYKVVIGPGGKHQWAVSDNSSSIFMLTADISLTKDSNYNRISKGFASSLTSLNSAFAAAWYKLTTRDMGPVSRCIGPFVPPAQPFQYPLPPAPSSFPDWNRVKRDLSSIILTDAPELVQLAFLCSATFRRTDYNGGCNGARIRFVQSWPGNKGLDKVLSKLAPIQSRFTNLSWADLIVFAGTLALGDNQLTFCPGRTDATDGSGLQYVQPKNFLNATVAQMRFDEDLLGLNDTEMVAISAKLRSAYLNAANGFEGTWSTNPKLLSNQYYKTLKAETWLAYNVSSSGYTQYKARGKNLYMFSNDLNLLFDAQYKKIVDTFASDNNSFMKYFRSVWTKLMNNDRFSGPTGNVCWNTSIPIGNIFE